MCNYELVLNQKEVVMKNSIGVWLDHATAKLIEISSDKALITTIQSPYKKHIRIPGLSISKERFGPDFYYNLEYKIHNRKIHDLSSYYKDLINRLKGFDEIVLFGPTKAKTELYNLLIQNKHFSLKTISIESKDKMSEKQMTTFVKKYFSNSPQRKAV